MLVRVAHVIDQFNVFIGTSKFLSKCPHLLPEIRDQSCSRVVVDCGAVGDEGSLGGVGESG